MIRISQRNKQTKKSSFRTVWIGTITTLVGLVAGWHAYEVKDARARGEESERAIVLQQELAKLRGIDNDRVKQQYRADSLDVEIKALTKNSEIAAGAAKAEIERLSNENLALKEQLSTARLKLSVQNKCAYLEELTRRSKAELDRMPVTIGLQDAFHSDHDRTQVEMECQQNRQALTSCLTTGAG